ncbi:MAG: serine/threonine-protein kinase, partial [Candidatus Nanoarchaeia archaeon]
MKEHIDISFWNRGIVRCDCGKEMPFSQKDGLNMIKCTACGNSSFVPYKISKFWLYRPLGGGGMGAVYKAITEDGQIFCAVKVLPRHKRNDPEFIKNLLVEIHAAEKFGAHKNLVKLIAAGKSPEGEYFMATEFIDGERLDRYVQERHQLTEREAFSIICQIFEAEKHICACGYLFRDLKPENVMIQKDGTARLFDYGLCKPIGEEQQSAIGSSVTDSDQIEGSPYYLPPERIVGATEGEYSEIYSMGMLFFYMLAGRTYYSESEINDIVVKHLTAIRIVSTGPHLRNCRSKIVTTIDKMIQRNPNSRFPDFASLDAAFKEIQKDLAGDSARDSGIKSKPETKTDDKYYDTTAGEQFPLPKNAKFAIVACVGAIILFSVAYIFFSLYSSIQKNKKIQRLRTETAKMLDIPENVAPPTMSKEEIEKIVAQKTDERMATLKDSIVEFDERGVIEKICKKLKIERFSEKKPLKSIAELKAEAENLIRKKAEEEFSKAILPFDSKKATEEII